MFVKISTTCGNLLLSTVYRPPSCDSFWEHFEHNIDNVRDTVDIKNIIILGDLNADSNTINGRHLRDVCINHNFICHIDEPTRTSGAVCRQQLAAPPASP